MTRLNRFALGLLTASLALPAPTFGHDIPARVTVLVFVKPQGQTLHLVVRVPLEAMRDVNFPLRGGEILDLERAQPLLHDAAKLWIAGYIEMYEDGVKLEAPLIAHTLISLPSDRSFIHYDSAIAHLRGAALPNFADLPWKQAMLDVALDYPIRSDQSRFSIHPALAHLGLHTSTVLRFLPPGGAERAYQYSGDPGLVRLDPRWHQAAWLFVKLGFTHILDGIDHLLFVLCLVIPIRRFRPLLVVVTSFTVAHSIMLGASAMGVAPSALWFPPLIEMLVAGSIVYMAIENIVGARLDKRWLIAFAFGLVHGFAFSFALREQMQFAGPHLVTSLVSFNVGVELGQIFVLALAIPALALLFKYVVAERMGTIILSAIVAHTAWHWMGDRFFALRQYRFERPAFDLALAASAMRGLILVLVIGLALWGLSAAGKRLARTGAESEIV